MLQSVVILNSLRRLVAGGFLNFMASLDVSGRVVGFLSDTAGHIVRGLGYTLDTVGRWCRWGALFIANPRQETR